MPAGYPLSPVYAASPLEFLQFWPTSRESIKFSRDAAASAAPRPARWDDPSFCSTAAGTTSPPPRSPPAGTPTAAAGSSSPTAPDWSAGSGWPSTPGTPPSPVAASGGGTRPPARTAVNNSTRCWPVNSTAGVTRVNLSLYPSTEATIALTGTSCPRTRHRQMISFQRISRCLP